MENFKRGLLNNLRKYLYDPASRGTSQTDNFDGTGSQKTFILTKNPLMFISSVTVSGVIQKLNRDYVIDFGTSKVPGEITFITAPAVGTDNVVVIYTYGSNWIYPGTPQTDNKQLPRIGFITVNSSHRPAGVSEIAEFIEASFRLSVWVKSGDEFTINGTRYYGDKLLDFIYNDISHKIINFRRDYYEPYNLITMRISGATDIPFDEENGFNRKEITLEVSYKKVYS